MLADPAGAIVAASFLKLKKQFTLNIPKIDLTNLLFLLKIDF